MDGKKSANRQICSANRPKCLKPPTEQRHLLAVGMVKKVLRILKTQVFNTIVMMKSTVEIVRSNI